MYLPINLVAIAVLAIVAGSGYHNYSGINQRARSATYRVILIRTDGRSPQTHVDDEDVVFVFVERIAGAYRFGRIRRSQNPVQGTQQY